MCDNDRYYELSLNFEFNLISLNAFYLLILGSGA